MVKNWIHFLVLFLQSIRAKIFALNDFWVFLTVHIFHGSKLTRFLLYIALNMGNSDQMKFLDYLVCFLSYNLYIFIFLTVRASSAMTYLQNFRFLNFNKIQIINDRDISLFWNNNRDTSQSFSFFDSAQT
jgi:hypothetical protein